MPTPEFVVLPDFLQFHCINEDSERCPTCPRDFSLQSNMVQGVYKDKEGKALLLVSAINYCPTPQCGDKLKFIQTTIPWADAMNLLDGKITSVGNIKMVEQDYILKG